jgi:hypothetical protein
MSYAASECGSRLGDRWDGEDSRTRCGLGNRASCPHIDFSIRTGIRSAVPRGSSIGRSSLRMTARLTQNSTSDTATYVPTRATAIDIVRVSAITESSMCSRPYARGIDTLRIAPLSEQRSDRVQERSHATQHCAATRHCWHRDCSCSEQHRSRPVLGSDIFPVPSTGGFGLPARPFTVIAQLPEP